MNIHCTFQSNQQQQHIANAASLLMARIRRIFGNGIYTIHTLLLHWDARVSHTANSIHTQSLNCVGVYAYTIRIIVYVSVNARVYA